MSDLSVQVGEASRFEDVAYRLPPPSIRARIRQGVAEFLCLVGMAAARAAKLWLHKRKFADPQKILVIRRGGLGDVLAATPLLRGLREHFPAAKIFVLVSQQAVLGLRDCPLVDQVFLVPKTTKGWLPLLQQLRSERIDTAFILHRFFAASLLAVASGIPRRLGFQWGNHGFALTASVPFSMARSQAEQIAGLLELVGKAHAEPHLEFPVDEDSIAQARTLLQRWGRDRERPLVAMHPGGGDLSESARRWPSARFGQLADLLIRKNNIQVVMLQGPADEGFVREAVQNMKTNLLGIASGLSLPLFAALMRECDLIIANDTGPMHLAAAQNVPVLAIIGPTHPAYNPPRGAMHRVIWAGASCAPCFNPEEYLYANRRNGRKVFECWCSTHECMMQITPEQVCVAAVQQITLHAASEQRVVSRSAHG